MLSFRCEIWGFQCKALGSWVQVGRFWVFRCQDLEAGCEVLSFRCKVLRVGVLDFGFWVQGLGF